MLAMLSVVTFGQQWVAIKSDTPNKIQTELLSSSESSITVKLQVPGFYAFAVNTPLGEANVISVPKTVSTAAAGEPDLPMIAIPTIIGDHQQYSIRVINAQYSDFQMEIAPSKGDFSRQIEPEDVPYTYGEAYNNNAFFPSQNVGLYEPYVLRDFRGQNMVIYPFAYNPISKTLRVYYNMTVEMYADGRQGRNTLERHSNEIRLDSEIQEIYGNHFINYSESLSKYTPINETGELLIICHDGFMDAMSPFVNWKKQIGRPVTMVGTSAVGSTDSAIKTYIQNQYTSNPNISHVLLVGDVAQIPGHSYSNCGNYSGKSDNWYGQVAGDDYYNELIIGRFSAENATQVTTQVDKVIHYERDITAADTWLVNGCGIAATAGNGGHFGEDDWQHVNNIRTDLMNYGYSTVYQEYYNTAGYTSTTQQISERVNGGVSIINYCNHGTYTAWQSHNPYYSNTYVNALTNDNMLPVIFSVACLVGKYDYSQPCFGETWLRATNNSNGNPTGAVAGMFSYINQPWVPPMYGQDEMIDVLVETYNNNTKRTMGGISYDGNMKILDQYGQNGGQGLGTYMAWILYGDPTLTIRNAIPANMNVTHAPSMSSNATSFTVNATNGNGALATLTRNGEIMGSATINNGTANIAFAAPGMTGTATLTVFGYNKITYVGTVNITGGGGTTYYTVNLSANPEEGGNVDGGGSHQQNSSCTVTATANEGYTFTNWTENGNVVSSNASYTFTVTGNRTLVANFAAQTQSYTVSVSADPSNGGTVTGGGSYQEGQSCTVNATANEGYTFINWTDGSEVVSTDASYTFEVTANRVLVAHFQIQSFTITVVSEPSTGGTASGGGTFNYGESCTVTATVNEGHTFHYWLENGNVVCTEATYTFTVTDDRNLVAIFTPHVYTIFALPNPPEGGNAEGGGSYDYGTTCSLSATANTGYAFVNWTEDDAQVSTSANYSFTVTDNRELVAHFELRSYTISVSVNPIGSGIVTGGGTYTYGTSCTLTALPHTGYTFQGWSQNGTIVSTSQAYTFTVTETANYVAQFAAQSYNITTNADPTEGGTVTGGGNYTHGQNCTLSATANEGYDFVSWRENGNVVSTETEYSFTVTSNRTLTANFELQQFEISATVNPEEGGSITGRGRYSYGEEVTLTVTANEDYAFRNWTDNGEVVSQDPNYTFVVTCNRTLVANLEYTVGLGENSVSARVYPNPTQGEVVVVCESLKLIRIVNAFGQTVYDAKAEGDQVHIDLSNMAKGIYMMHIEAEGGLTVRKIVVE